MLRDGPQLAARHRSCPASERATTACCLAARAAVDRSSPGHVYAPLLKRTEDGQGRGVGERTTTIRKTPTPQTAGTQYFAMDVDEVPAVGGSRPDRVFDVSVPQERVQRRIVQQTTDVVPLPMLDAPVPQMVGQLAEVLQRHVACSRAGYRGAQDHCGPGPSALFAGGAARGCARATERHPGTWHGYCGQYLVSGYGAPSYEVEGLLVAEGHKSRPVGPSGGIHRQPRAVFKC